MDLKNYFEIVEKKAIPEYERKSKYKTLIEQAKKLEGTQAIKVVEGEGLSLPAIASMMIKQKYKVTHRTINKKKVLFISKKTE